MRIPAGAKSRAACDSFGTGLPGMLVNLMKLLIADDHMGVRRMIREMLSHVASEIHECANGLDALHKYDEILPDFVIMDLQMPELDGFEAMRRLIADYPRARVIAMSHLRDPEVEMHARKTGACYFVRKENLFDLARYLGRSVNP